MTSVAAPFGATTALADLDAITDEERLRMMWQQAEDFGERRRIRARMYKLREQRLREMMQNDEESLGTLNVTDDGGATESTETTITIEEGGNTSRRSSNIQVTMHVDGDSAITDSISTQNIRLGGLTMRGVDTVNLEGLEPDDIIQERIRKASDDRATRFQRIIGELSDSEVNSEGDAVVSITKSTYSIQSNALAGEGYLSMKNKEVRDSVSPTRIMRERRSSAEDETSANEGRLTSDDEAALRTETENVTQSLQTSTSKTSSSRKSSRDERTTSTRTARSRQSEIPVRKESSSRKVSERKTSKELDLSSAKRTGGEKASPTSPTKRTPGESSSRSNMPRRTGAQKEAPTSPNKSPTRTGSKIAPSSKKSKLAEIESKMETSIMSELDKLDSYLRASVSDDDEIIMEEEEDCIDDSGNVVKMLVQTRRKKDGTECTARRVARSTKVVNTESEIDEILIGNPDHEVLERNVAEEEDKEGNKIKIITETRCRPDGITYTTKNILKTSKIFDYDHPEDVAYNEEDELISTNETEETDENGITIQTVTETRRKPSGMEYTTKKVYKTSKVKSTQITPSDDDEVIDTKETEERKDDGSIIRTVIETRRTKGGEEYTHRQVFRSRRMTLSGVDLQKGLPTIQNDDEVVNRKEKEETDESGMTVKVVTETRRRKDGSTYSFEYVLRSFQGTEDDVKKMPVGSSGSSNIAVSADDELINEDVKEDVKEDGSTIKTIIERRRAKDGTEYLRHRIMRIPKMPEPVLQVANLDDEVLQEEVKEKTLNDGTHYKAVTERRRSSVSGLQYTLRRMSKVYQQPTHHPRSLEDEILDENVTEEETDDGTVVKTVIQRYQRPDGSVYTTHNIHRTFSSPAPVTFVGTENDELVDQSVDEKETEDGCIIKTVIERRRRSDGVQYTVERTEKTSKFGPQVHITYSGNERHQKPEDVVQVGSPDDKVVSSEENEYEEEDGTIVRTVVEVRCRIDGTEYTTKTVLRSTPILVPEREMSYVVIKPEGGNEDEEVGFFPSLDDEIVYTRKKEEIGDDGKPTTVIIETRQSKTTGEKYNITKRVHTQDVFMTEEGEREIPKAVMKSTLVAHLAPSTTTRQGKKPDTTNEEPDDEPDDVPYGSVSALKNRFAPASSKKPDSTDKPSKPDRLNTLNKKKFFEEAAKSAGGSAPLKYSPRKSEPKDRPREPDKDAKRDLLPAFSDDKASIEVKLRIEKDQATVEDVETRKVTYQAEEASQEYPVIATEPKDVNIKDLETEIAKLEEEEKRRYIQDDQLEPEDIEEQEEDISPDEVEPEEEISSPSEEEPQEPPKKKPEVSKKSPTALKKTVEKPRKKAEEPRKKHELSPRKKPDTDEPSRRVPTTSRKLPSKDDSPTRRIPAQKEPITPKESTKRVPKATTSPQRVPSSPNRGRSPNRSGVSTPRDVTPTGRNCCRTHRAANETEPVSPTRTQKTTPRSTVPSVRKTTSPEGKPKINGDVRRTPAEPKLNGDIKRRPEDRTQRTRKPVEKVNEPERSSVRPSRLSQTPRKAPTTRSPDKREPVKPLSSRTPDRKSPTKPSERSPKSRSPDFESKEKPKSSLSVPEPRDPVVTLPETPMTEDMKYLPVDDELGPVIEDVSCEPDLPYHTIHRPSIVREPSEYNARDSQEEGSDSACEEQPEHPEELSDTEFKDAKPVKSSRKPKESSPVREEISKPRKTRPLESRPSDKSLSPKDEAPKKKQPDTRRTTRDRPWLTEKRNSFEKKPSEPKLSAVKPDDDKKIEKKKPFERKPSEEAIVKPKEEKPYEKLPDEESYFSSDSEEKENGVSEETTEELMPSTQEVPEDVRKLPKKTEEMPAKLADYEKSVASRIITEKNEKNITTSEVAARRSVFNARLSQPDTKKDKPTRKPSYEIKESVFSKRSMFEQPKQDPIPAPIRKPLFKSSVKKEEKPKKPEDRKPVREPVIVPKYFHPLGEGDSDEPVEKTAPEPVEDDIKMTSSKLVMNAMATTSHTRTTEERRESTKQEPSFEDEIIPVEKDTIKPLKKDRSPSPYSRESPSLSHSKEGSPTPRSKEPSPAPFSKEGSPTRFITGRPIDSGINTNKIRRIERTSSNKKLIEDLEVSRDSLPQYLSSIETIFDVTILENMLEKAETYEERRIIRGQLRIAKRPGSRTTTTSTPSSWTSPSKPSTTTVSSQPRRPTEQRATKPKHTEDSSLDDTRQKPLSKSSLHPEDDYPVPAPSENEKPRSTRKYPEDEPEKHKQPEEPRESERPRYSRKYPKDEPEKYKQPEEPRESERPRSTRKYPEDEPEKYKQPEEPRESERPRYSRKYPEDEPEKYKQPDEPRESERPRYTRKYPEDEPEKYKQPEEPKESERPRYTRKYPEDEPEKYKQPEEPKEPERPRYTRKYPEDEPEKYKQPEEPKESERPRSTRKYPEDEPEKYKQPEEPRESERQVKPEEPRKFGRYSKPEEPKKYVSSSRIPESSKPEKRQTQPTKTAPSDEPYSEPLRYQKGQSRTPSKPAAEQTDVDKIISAYGVGPTDENGLPLFGLRALKRRSPPTTCVSTPREEQAEPRDEEPKTVEEPEPYSEPEEPKKEEYVPKDSSGRPLFGLRALRKPSPTTTSVTTTEATSERATSVLQKREIASSVVESSRLVSSVVSQRATHATDVVSTESPLDSESPEPEDLESDSEDETESLEHYSDEEETSPGLVRNLRDSLKKKNLTEEPRPTTKSTPRLRDTPSGQSPDQSGSGPEDEVISRRSQPLKEILKLHESKVQEPAVVEESPRLKPKQRLRENFETTSETEESRVHKTWDLETDLSTRSLDMKNIIARHETITSEETPKAKKLTGILKKTSSSNILGTDTRSIVTSEITIDNETKEDLKVKDQLSSPDDILDTLTEDQITRLSEEFDLRAQEDGVIKTEESVEELSGGYRVASRTEADHPDGFKFVRKTSYTEIKLQQPSKEEGSRVVQSSSSATVDQTSGATFHVSRGGSSRSGEAVSSSTRELIDSDDAMREGRSFLDDRSKVTGITDVLSRMGATEAVDHESKVTSDDQARSLLNRFLGAQVLMSGVESMMASSSLNESSRVVRDGEGRSTVTQEESGHSSSTTTKDGAVTHHHDTSYATGPTTITTTSTSAGAPLKDSAEQVVVRGVNITEVTDDYKLNQLLDSCDEYEDRRRIRMRLKSLMAEKKALREELSGHDLGQGSRTQGSSAQSKFEAVSKSTTSSSKESNLRSSEGDAKTSSTVSPFGVSRTSVVTDSRSSNQASNVQKSSYSSSFSTSSTSNSSSFISKTDSKKVVSPFDKFKQLDAQTSPRPARE